MKCKMEIITKGLESWSHERHKSCARQLLPECNQVLPCKYENFINLFWDSFRGTQKLFRFIWDWIKKKLFCYNKETFYFSRCLRMLPKILRLLCQEPLSWFSNSACYAISLLHIFIISKNCKFAQTFKVKSMDFHCSWQRKFHHVFSLVKDLIRSPKSHTRLFVFHLSSRRSAESHGQLVTNKQTQIIIKCCKWKNNKRRKKYSNKNSSFCLHLFYSILFCCEIIEMFFSSCFSVESLDKKRKIQKRKKNVDNKKSNRRMKIRCFWPGRGKKCCTTSTQQKDKEKRVY